MEIRTVNSYNNKGELHGIRVWYYGGIVGDYIGCRANFKNRIHDGLREDYGSNSNLYKLRFYIL